MRLISPEGKQLGVVETSKAIKVAKSMGLDLLEISNSSEFPICRILDYGKYKYEQSKLKKKSVKTTTRIKEIKLSVRMEDHDYQIKMARSENFLEEGHKVRMRLQFKGRENAHRDLGFVVMKRVEEDLLGMAQIDQAAKLMGRMVGMVLSPLPANQRKRRFLLSHGKLIEDIEADDSEELEADAKDYESSGSEVLEADRQDQKAGTIKSDN